MKILVTGGEGFLGSNLVPALLKDGHFVTVISHSQKMKVFQNQSNLNVVQGEYSDPEILNEFLPGIDLIIHLAYSTVPENSTNNPVFDIQSNVIPTLFLLNQAILKNVKRFFFVSSGGVVYGNKSIFPLKEDDTLNPVSSYGISKMMIEYQIQLLTSGKEIDFCIFRIANAYGLGQHNRKNQGVINIWMEQILNDIPVKIIGDGDIIRDYVHVDDIVDVFKLAIKNECKGVFNVGTGIGTDLKQLLQIIESVLGKKAKIERIDNRKFDVEKNVLSFEKFNKATGWNPKFDLKNGILAMKIKNQ